jgi:hypothetical protein
LDFSHQNYSLTFFQSLIFSSKILFCLLPFATQMTENPDNLTDCQLAEQAVLDPVYNWVRIGHILCGLVISFLLLKIVRQCSRTNLPLHGNLKVKIGFFIILNYPNNYHIVYYYTLNLPLASAGQCAFLLCNIRMVLFADFCTFLGSKIFI